MARGGIKFFFKHIGISRIFNIAKIARRIREVSKKEGRALVRALNNTVRSWKGNRPSFGYETVIKNGDLSIVAFPDGNEKGVEKFEYLDYGTKPHTIRAKRVPYLGFYSKGFVSKTRPKSFLSRSGKKATSGFVRKKSVRHPGIEARDWTASLEKKREPYLQKAIEDAIKNA